MKHVIWVTWEVEDSSGHPTAIASRVVYDSHDQAAMRYGWMSGHLSDWLQEHDHIGVLNPRVELAPARDCQQCEAAAKKEAQRIDLQRLNAVKASA